MIFDFKVDLSGLEQLGKDTEAATVDVLREMAAAQVANILRRAQKGVGLDDRAMPPLTKEYAEKKGRSLRDLNLTGAMLRAIHVEQVRATREGAEAIIAFADQQSALKALGNQARAPWFGVSPKDAEALARLAESILAEML